MKKLSLVLPVYNEEAIIMDSARKTIDFAESKFKGDYEIIFVNDGSSDSTPEILSRFASGNVKLISYGKNMGKGYAVRKGILAAENEYIIFTDSDLAYGLDAVCDFVDAMENDKECDLAIGSRMLHAGGYEGYTFTRKLISKSFLLVLKIIGGLKTSDSQTGIKGFKHRQAKVIFKNCEENRWAFDFEMILTAQAMNMKIKEIPVNIIKNGESKMSFIKDSFKMFSDIVKIKKRIKKKGAAIVQREK